MAIEWSLKAQDGPMIGFWLQDLEGISTPCNGTLVIRATVVNYGVAWVFIDSSNLINVLF